MTKDLKVKSKLPVRNQVNSNRKLMWKTRLLTRISIHLRKWIHLMMKKKNQIKVKQCFHLLMMKLQPEKWNRRMTKILPKSLVRKFSKKITTEI